MSDPFGTSVPLGMNTEVGRSEWQEFLARRRELINNSMQQLGLSQQLSMQTGMPQLPVFQATSLLMPNQTAQQRAVEMQQPVTDPEYRRLLGAADFYGIENAETLPADELRRLVEQHRDYLESRRMEEDPSVAGAIYDTISTFLGTTGLGAVDAVAGGLQRIPFVGDAIRKYTGVEEFQRGLAMLEEGFTGDMLDNEQAAYEKWARPLQHFLGYSALVGVAAEGVGAAGFAGGVANPLVRGSLQGAATGWILEGGGEEAISERAMKIALFAGLQGAAEWGLPKLAARLSRSFPRPSQWFVPEAQMGQRGATAGTVDAEWAYFDEGAQRLIGPGGAPGGAAPPGTPQLGPGGIPGAPIVAEQAASALPSVPQLSPGQMQPGTMWAGPGMTSFPRAPRLGTGEAAGTQLQYRGWQPESVPYTEIEGDARLHTFITPSGEPIEVRTDYVADRGVIYVNWIGRPIRPGIDNPASMAAVPEVGPAAVQSIMSQIAQQHPEAQTIRGWRISGAAPEREAVVQTSRYLSSLQASGDAIAATKQGMILESPALPELSRQSTLQDADVAIAAMATNPGQISVIQDVGDTAGTIRRFLQEALPNGVGPQDFRAIVRGNRTDLLVADGRTITNKMAKEYETYGMFRGQQATTAQGHQVVIEALGPEFSTVRAIAGDPVTVPTAELLPGKSSMVADAAPEAYIELKSYALSRMAQETIDSGLQPFDWFSDELATQLPRYIDEFLSMKAVEGTAARAVYTASFTEARVREFRTLAPEEFAQVDAIQQEISEALAGGAMQEGRSVSIAEIAETKGLRWEATPNELGGNLIDQFSGEVIPVESTEAAFSFLRDFNRTVPDYSPFSTVPVELAAGPVGMPGAGSSMSPNHFGTTEAIVREGHSELDQIERELSAETSGGGSLPPPPGGAGLPPGAGNAGPGGEFGNLHDSSFDKFRQLEVRFDRMHRHWLEPMRGYAARVTEDMNRFGIRANYWEDVSAIENASAVAHNEIEPWSREFSSALAKIRNRRVRDGTVVLIGELPEAQAVAAMRNAGYTAREFEGQQQLRQLWHRVGDEYGVRRILEYWPHLRSADSPENAAQRILRQDFTGPGRWFAEQVRLGGIDFREMNAEVLINKWLRGAAFSRHVAPHVERMTGQWVQDPRIPENLRITTSNWLSLVTTGYVPGGGRLFDGIAATFQAVKIPVNTRDVEAIARWSLSNTYRAMLGGRPVAVVREMINPLLAWARIGHTEDLGRAMVQFARNPAYREEAVQRGLRGGWIMRYAYGELSQEPLRAAGRGAIPGIATPANEFTPMQNAVREGVAQVGDVFTDARNRVLPQGFNNSIIDPLRPVDKVNEFGRLITGESGYQAMRRALVDYNAARSSAGPMIDVRALNGRLLVSSGAANLHESVQRSIIRLVDMGDQEGAANLFANEVANQLARFGAIDQPPAMHSAGVVGKLGLQFGNFAIQYQAAMREGLSASGLAREFGGSGFTKAVTGTKFAARHALIAGGLSLAGAYTGWNFLKWMWHGSLGWGGGPLLMALVDEFRSIGARYKESQGEFLTPVERALLVETNGNLGQALINPYMGAMRTAEQLGNAASYTNPLESAAQFFMTGQMTGAQFNRDVGDAVWGVAPLPAWMGGQVPQQQPVVPLGAGGQF